MPNYNSGYKYNVDNTENGLFYNTDYRIFVSLKEVIAISDDVSKLLATFALKDKPFKTYDAIASSALYGVQDTLPFSESASSVSLFEVTDMFGITDEVSELLVLATLYDRQDIIDEARQLNEIIENEQLIVGDDTSLATLIETLDSFGLKELEEFVEILFTLYEQQGITDGIPRSAISDFVIGEGDGLDTAYDWFIPFNMKVDWNSTNIQVMPEASNTVIEMPGIDGSIIEDTVYKDRLFSIVAFSEDGLTKAEKEELKAKITEILDSTKHNTRMLTVQAHDTSFDVKYDGQAVIAEGPSYVKATIPFKTSPYGHKTFDGELYGNGLVYNDGDAPVGAKHKITGPISNPSFTLGEVEYSWAGEVPDKMVLVIDHQMMTCYLQDEFGKKANAMNKLSGAFQKIPAHSSVALTAKKYVSDVIHTTWRDMVLW